MEEVQLGQQSARSLLHRLDSHRSKEQPHTIRCDPRQWPQAQQATASDANGNALWVFCGLRYRLTLRDLSEIMLLRGFTVSHECVRQWAAEAAACHHRVPQCGLNTPLT
jgi:hypothetical protein